MIDRREFDVLIIGAGPAGLAAACCAAEAGRRVGVVDDNPTAGGQIWRGEQGKPTQPAAVMWFERLRKAKLEFLPGTRIVGHPTNGVLLADDDQKLLELKYNKLILATGARERFLPFPGWTLPGVTGAGGLQASVKSGMSIAGRRVVVAGSGPLLLAVAAYLRRAGAIVPLIAEQSPRGRVAKFAAGLLAHPAKLTEAARLKWELRGVKYLTDCWPAAAGGDDDTVKSVTLHRRGRTWQEPCDFLACGFGLVPNIELPMLLGCEIEQGKVRVDDGQRTTVNNVYAVGEVTGIGGLAHALIEGQIAGLAAAGEKDAALHFLLFPRRSARRFAQKLEHAFRLRDELRQLPAADTIVCRCEDVRFDQLTQHRSWRSAKLHTRCGMGPCQGRVCGAATEFLFGWGMDSVRPPLYPVRVEHLAEATVTPESSSDVD
jgi:NADPH-dependent 2,4-dienoyl-CoA reductase/sulfur reductase-like enzyme